jgi:cobalt/nickel transport system ATP-binding protein
VEPLSLELAGVAHRHAGASRDTPPPVTFRLGAGEKGLLLGPNGSGKSTLLARVVGLLEGPGEVSFGGQRVSRETLPALRRRVGFLWQRPDDGLLLPIVRDDVALGPANDDPRADTHAIAARWLERLGIAHLGDRRVRELSLGERQLVAIAGVLAREPGLLLLDEPVSALDEGARTRLSRLLAELPTTILVATHEPELWLDSSSAWRPTVRLD